MVDNRITKMILRINGIKDQIHSKKAEALGGREYGKRELAIHIIQLQTKLKQYLAEFSQILDGTITEVHYTILNNQGIPVRKGFKTYLGTKDEVDTYIKALSQITHTNIRIDGVQEKKTQDISEETIL